MSLSDHTKKPRTDGWRGYRVVVKVNGKVIQKYFPPGHFEEAKMWDDYLIAQAKKYGNHDARYRVPYEFKTPRYDPPKRTQIVGLTMAFQRQKKCNPVRFYPVYVISHKNYVTSRGIGYRGPITAWRLVCDMLTDMQGMPQTPKAWYEAQPSYEDWDKLRLWYNHHNAEKIHINNMACFHRPETAEGLTEDAVSHVSASTARQHWKARQLDLLSKKRS